MTQTVLHFVFTPSGAVLLRQALEKAGREDGLIAPFENLSYGPINPVDPVLHAKWVEDELGEPRWRDERDDTFDRKWDKALLSESRKVGWLTRRSASEYAGFLDWLWQVGDQLCEVVDLTDVVVAGVWEKTGPPRLATSLNWIPPDIIHRDKLWDMAKPLTADARQQYRNLWEQLRSENAPLRVTDGNKLVSAPLSFFDSSLMSHVTRKWRKASLVVGETMTGERDDIVGPDDILLRGRIRALVRSGQLEMQGEVNRNMFDARLRLPGAQ